MENLELSKIVTTKLPGCPKNVKQILIFKNGKVVYADGKLLLHHTEHGVCKEYTLHSDDHRQLRTKVEYLAIEQKLWFGTRDAFYIYDIRQHKMKQIIADFSYTFATWNIAEDTLLVILTDRTVYALAYNFELNQFHIDDYCTLHEVPPPSYNCRWCPEEPEFRSALAIIDKSKPLEIGIPAYYGSMVVAWQKRGLYYAINCLRKGHRIIIIMRLPAEVCYTVEGITGLQRPIAWRPTRDIIAAHVHSNRNSTITFFEKNGEKFSSFDLPDYIDAVHDIQWSPCGQILLVHQGNFLQKQYIDFYTTNNSSWFLKQRMEIHHSLYVVGSEFVHTEENVHEFRLILSSVILEYTFKSVIHTNDSSVCAVTRGNSVHFTDFNTVIMPPPFSQLSVKTTHPVNFVVFNPIDSSLILIDSKYVLYQYIRSSTGIKKIRECKLTYSKLYPLALRLFFCDTASKIYCNYLQLDKTSRVAHFNLHAPVVSESFTIRGDSVYNAITRSMNSAHTIRQSSHMDITCTKDFRVTIALYTKTSPSFSLAAMVVEEKLYVFNLTTTGEFYINKLKIASNVNSYLFHCDFLFLSKGEGKLYAIRMVAEELELLFAKKDIIYWHIRNFELGAILVTGIKVTKKIVCQIPRGNLEVIMFNLIGIKQVDDLLDENKWEAAVDFISLEKLNSNLLIDLDPQRFLLNIEEFVITVNSAKVIDTILLELQDTSAVPNNYYKKDIPPLQNKKNQILDGIVNYVKTKNSAAYLSTVIVCYYLKQDYMAAFEFITDFLLSEERDLALEALEVLLLYMDNMTTFNTSLLTYNVDTIDFVAKNSQLDPLQYEDLLRRLIHADKELANKDELMFIVHDYLNQPKSAIYSILFQHDADNSEQLLSYAKEHNLFKQSFIYLSKITENENCKRKYAIIGEAYGTYLKNEKLYDAAGVIFGKLELFDQCYESYKLALNWKNAFRVLQKCNLTQEESVKEYELMALELIKVKRFKEAGDIYYEYCSCFDKAIDTFLSNDLFEDATYLAYKSNETDVLQTRIYPAVVEYSKKLYKSIDFFKTEIGFFTNRLKIVRQSKVDAFTNQEHPDNQDFISDTDSTSSASSQRSNRTNQSTASARFRRKQQLKKQNLKEGGQYEDIALMRVIYLTIKNITECTKDVQKTCELILNMPINYYDSANELQILLLDTYDMIAKCSIEVWPKYLYESESITQIQALLKTNFGELDEEFRKPHILPENSTWVNVLLDS